MFENAKEKSVYHEAPNKNQHSMAKQLGISIEGVKTRIDAAGKLYEVQLRKAWVYSVHRQIREIKTGVYAECGLPEATALAIAREMLTANPGEDFRDYSTTDSREGDVFFRISPSTKESPSYQFVCERLKSLKPPQSKTGCLVILILAGSVALVKSYLF